MSRAASTPLMQQYREIKSRHQDAILFFRMGDFYEMFYEDAEVASKTLGLTLTRVTNGGRERVHCRFPVKGLANTCRDWSQHGFVCRSASNRRSTVRKSHRHGEVV